MKLFLQDDVGLFTKIESVKRIGQGDVIIRLNQCCREEDTERMEQYLKRKLKRNVVLLDARYGEILTLPPETVPGASLRRP